MNNSFSALLAKGSPVAGVNGFSSPGTTPSAPGTMDFRQGQTTPMNQMYEQGGLVTPQGPQMGGQPVPPQGQAPQGGAPNVGVQDIKAEVDRIKQQHPEVVQQIQTLVMEGIQSGELTMQELNMAVQLATAAMQNPQLWPKLRQMAIQQGLAQEEEVPMQYDAGLTAAIIIAGEMVAGQQAPQGAAPAAMGQPPVAAMAIGEQVPDSKNSDGSVSAIVHEGEYVIPKHVVARKGTEFFDKLTGKDETNTA